MKIRHTRLILGFASSVALALGTATSNALTSNDGDIFLGFRVSGAAQDSLLVNLGPYTQFKNAAPGSTLTFGGPLTLGLDLATYDNGTSWFDRTDLSWSLFGGFGGDGVTLFATKARTNLGTPATYTYGTPTSGVRNTTYNAINTVENGFKGTGYSTTASTNTPNAGFQTGTGTNSYYAAVNPGSDFGYFASIEGSNASGIDNTALDLFYVSATSNPNLVNGTSPGKFTIDSAGTVTFTAVPEPTISVLLLAGVAGFALRRRRPQPALA